MHKQDIEKLRDTLQHRVYATGLRRTAREVGLSAGGLMNFLEGAAPYNKTIGKLRSWYGRHQENDHRDRQQILLDELLLTLPLHRRDEARRRLTSVVDPDA